MPKEVNQFVIPSCANCKNRAITAFCSLSPIELDNLSDSKVYKVFKRGEVIFAAGAYPHEIYGVYDGKIKIHKRGDEGKEQIVRFASKGDLLGYRSLLTGEPYSAYATALEKTILCSISKERFELALSNNYNVVMQLLQSLSICLKRSERLLVNMLQKPVKEKIAESLLIIKENFGYLEDSNYLDVLLSRREIGDLAGTTTESAIRTLSILNHEKVIKLDGKKIAIENLNALIEIANINE
jgi:CRP/FNR family transcriptional regulator, polysaccharide utilization system transcription regulator